MLSQTLNEMLRNDIKLYDDRTAFKVKNREEIYIDFLSRIL
jgi:hypothetical protein